MRLVDAESLPNWNQIATGIPCPTCFVAVGDLCVERGMSLPKYRADYHSARKLNALAFYLQGPKKEPEPINKEEVEVAEGPKPFGA